MQDNANKRIIKNTLLLYMRTIITMVVMLYTSRIVLKSLGVIDFGIYNIVGEVIALFSFLIASASGATNRFITYALGNADLEKQQQAFGGAIAINAIIAFVIFILAETIGVWIVNHKLVIPENQIAVTNWIYQILIVLTIFSIMQIPFSASLIAHEKMDTYAYIEILRSLLGLFIAFAIYFAANKLILYAVFMCSISAIITFIYKSYCQKHFAECKQIKFDRATIKSMLKFSGWDLFGNFSCSIKDRGTNIVLNVFFGVVANAAVGITNIVTTAISYLSGSMGMAIRPQIIKCYASNNFTEMYKLIANSAQYSLLLFALFAIPIEIEIYYILYVWLGEPPMYTADFCRLSILIVGLGLLTSPTGTAIHATGKIKNISIYPGIVNIISIITIYLCLLIYQKPIVAYIVMAIFSVINAAINIFVLKKQIPNFNVSNFFTSIALKTIPIIATSFAVGIVVHYTMNNSIVKIVSICAITAIFTIFATYFFAFDNEKRTLAKSYFSQITNKHKC